MAETPPRCHQAHGAARVLPGAGLRREGVTAAPGARSSSLRGSPEGRAQHSLTLTGICNASPPSDVSLYLVLMSCAVAHIDRMTASSDTLAWAGSLSSAMLQ